MRIFKKSTAWSLVLCLVLSLVLSVGPMAAQVKGEANDPYVYYWRPADELVPEYYERYARPYMLYSGHNVHHKAMDEGGIFQVRFFNVVNVDELIADEADAPSGGYATTGAFCSDAETYIVAGTAYRRLNLEDGYFNTNPDTTAGTVDARKIRAVLRNSMPNLEDLPAFEKKINAYLTATYGEDSVLVSGLTGSQLMSATQSAIWHYANGFDFGSPYPYQSSDDFASWQQLTIDATNMTISYPDYPTNYMDIANDTTATNINGVYQYLLSLPGESPREIMITDESISLADAVISGDQGTVTLLVNINGTINADDVLNLTVKCGDQTKNFSLGSVNTLDSVDGLYPITLTGVSAEDCESVELVISGKQAVDDVCFFEAKPTDDIDGRKASQNLAGYGHDIAPVYSEASINVLEQASLLEITKVDEQSGNPLSGVAFDLYRKMEGEDLLIGNYITDENGKITVHVTDTDEFYFVETDALKGYEVISGKIDAGEVPNSWNAGRLEVSKKLINTTPAQVGETFDFKLTLDLSTAPVMGNGLSWMTDHYIMEQLDCSKKLDWTVSGESELTATFTLNADETVSIDSIPLGATYTLEEVMTEENRAWFSVTSKVDDNAPQKSHTAAGTVAKNNAVLFTNSVVTGPDLKLGNLEISKELVNTTPAQVGETFDFKITLDFSTADVYTNGAPWMNDAYLLSKVSSSEALQWIKINDKYAALFTVDAGETVTIEGLAQGTTYTVEEVLTKAEREWFTVTSKVDDAAEKDSNIAQSFIAEKNAVLFTNSVVTCDVALSKLAVSKSLINTTPAQVEETFNFKITLDFSTADVYTNAVPWMNDEYLMDFVNSTEDLNWTEKDGKYTATFTLNADETVSIEGLALGTTYTVEEIMTEEDRAWFHVTSKVCNDPQENSNTAEGRIAQLNAVLFTNTVITGNLKLGDLDISKKLINTTPAQVGETFNFKITLDLSTADIYTQEVPWMNDEYLMDFVNSAENLTWTEENGKYTATFTVDADETVNISGLAYGTTYTVEEILTEEEREWFESSAQIGDKVTGSAAQSTIAEKNAVLFTNSVVTGPVLVTGSVEVSKKLINTTPAQVGETFNFRITLDLSTADVYTNAAPWMNDAYLLSFITGTEELNWTEKDGKYTATFTVDADETFCVGGIAQGATYTVQEILTEEDREWFTTTAQIGQEEAKSSDTVESTVAENNAVLFTNTVVTGPELKLGDPSVSKKLINTTPADVRETFDFQITVDFSTADVYTDAAPWMNDEYLMSFVSGTEKLTWTEKDGKYTATFSVDANETFTVSGLAYGTTYTMQELFTAEDYEWFTVTCQVGQEAATASHILESTVGDNNTMVFTNTVVTGPELELGGLNVSKKLINTTPAQVGETFNFQITVDFSTADVYTDAAPWMNDAYLLSQISSTENLIWTEENGKYTATFTVDADETVTIEGLAQGATYTVEEILTEDNRVWFTTTSQIGEEEAKVSDTVESTVAEKNAVTFTNTVVTGPELELGDLSLSKQLINETPAEVWETFNFQITLDFSTADVYTDAAPWMNDAYLLSFVTSTEDLTWTEKDGKYTAAFTIDADETVTIEGLAHGTTYTLEEVMTEEDWQWFNVTSKVGNETDRKTNVVESTVGDLNAILFTNSVVTGELKRGRLDVTKKLINTTPALVGDTFKFKITVDFASADIYTQGVPWVTDAYLLDFIKTTEVLEWTEVDGKFSAIFTVKADETITFNGLACGATYTIEEILTEEDREWFENNAQIGDTIVGSVAQSIVAPQNTVVFTNSVITGPALVTGSVDVSKKLVNTTPAQVGETFNFRITLDLSTADVYVDAAPWMNDEYLMSFVTGTEDLTWIEADGKYVASFTVNADETFTVSGIAQGATYTVQEILTEEDRAWFTTTSQIGEEEAKASDTVESTVAEKNAVTFTNTVVTGIALATGRLNVGKELDNANEAQAHKTFNFRITLDLSQADIYQNPAPWLFDEYLLDRIEGNQPLTWTKTGEKTYTATFTLKAGEAIDIDGLALGTGYTIEEVFSAEDRNNYRVTTIVSCNGAESSRNESALITGQIGDENDVTFVNKCVEKIPVTEDRNLTAPLMLCLLSVLLAAALLLNKRRFIG